MNSILLFQKRLRDETATVVQEVQALNERLERLRRAAKLLESEQVAIQELLLISTADEHTNAQGLPISPVAKLPKGATNSKGTAVRKAVNRNAQTGGTKRKTRPIARAAGHYGSLSRVDMIAAALRRHPRRTVRELIALLDKEYRWQTTESAVTGHLYTHRDKFVHTPADRSANRLVTWSSK
jgi:hypothetical protein